MLAQLKFSPDSKPNDVAIAISEIWDSVKVVHVQRNFEGEPETLHSFYDSVLEELGNPVHIAESATIEDRQSQRTGERWMEIRYDPDIKDAYRHSPNPQPLHTDGSYIPSFPDAALIYCRANADAGGETIFLDSKTLVEALKNDAPDLYTELTQRTVTHSRSGDEFVGKIIDLDNNDTTIHWNYYCVAKSSDDETQSLKERFHEFLQTNDTIKNGLEEVKLAPGDCVIWKDSKTLHGRNGFSPTMKSERFLLKSAVQIG